MIRTTITLDDDLVRLLEHEARRSGESRSKLIRRLIRKALLGPPATPRELPWAGMFHDPKMVAGRDVEKELERDWSIDLDRRR